MRDDTPIPTGVRRPLGRRTLLRRTAAGLLAAGLPAALTACGDIAETKTTTAKQLLALPGIDRADGLRVGGELVAEKKLYQAALDDTVKLYSASGKEAEDLTIARFEAETGVRVELTRLPNNKLGERVLSEHGAGKLSAGIIRSTDRRLAADLAKAGAFVPYRTPFHDLLRQQNAVPDDRFWTGYYFVNAMGYNSAVLTDNPPTGWHDLTDLRFRGKLGIVAITTGGTLNALTRFQIETFGPEFLYAQARLKPRIFDSTSTQVDALARGEIAIASLSFNNAFAAQVAGAPLKLIVPEEGVSASPGPLGITPAGLRSPAAQVFANWSMSKAGQRFAGAQGFVPARTDIEPVKSGEYSLPQADNPRFHLLTEAAYTRHGASDERVWRRAFHFVG